MKWIGLTGGIASGKSRVANLLRDHGLQVIDADELARRAVQKGSPGLKAVVQLFGSDILNEDGELNREKLGRIVFSDVAKRTQLEKIVHPLIQELRASERRRLEQNENEVAFYDVPLLFEKKMESEFDSVILVYSRPEIQRQRLRERDGLSEGEIEQRISAQMPIDEKLKLANYVILNNSSMADLKANVESVLRELNLI